MIGVPRATPPPKIQRISIANWLKGTVTAFSDGRTPTAGLLKSGNVFLDQDGTIRPRPSLLMYGSQPLGPILGDIFEFTDTSTGIQINSLITMQHVAGDSKIYTSIDGGAWTVDPNGIVFDDHAEVHYCQVDNKVLILNGADPLAYFDIPTVGVVQFVALSTPGGISISKNGLSGSTYTYYYKITANSSVGETDASAEASQTVGSPREVWDTATNNLDLSWSAVTDAVSYNVYMGTVSGDEKLIAAGVNGLAFHDDGSTAADVTRTAPVVNTTDGPVCTRGTVIDGQVFLTGDRDDPFIVRNGGVQGAVLDFSPFDGGGTTLIGGGTKELPVRVMPFRTGKGDSAITVLCKGTNGAGKRYIMTPDSTTFGSGQAFTVIDFFDVTEDNGQAGTDAPDGVILYNDALWYPSADGFKTTGTKPQLQNILSTDTISETIIRDIPRLSTTAMDGCVGIANLGRLYWAVPVENSTNNQIWVLDLNRNGAWMEPWNIPADRMVLYNDNFGVSHHLVYSGGIIYEFSDIHFTNDDGIGGFNTNATSGIYKFSPDSLDWAKVIDLTFILLQPQGTISVAVRGHTDDGDISIVQAENFIQESSVCGWGESGWSGSPDGTYSEIFGWSDFPGVPDTVSDAQTLMVVPVDEELEWIGWELNTTGTGINYQIADVIARYVDIGTKDLS